MAFPNYGKLLLSPHGSKPGSAIQRTEFETGPAKQTKIRSRVSVERAIAIQYTVDELVSFETWFRGAECNWGAGWFDWTDPRDGQVKQARVLNGEYDTNTVSAGEGAPLEHIVGLKLEYMEG